MSVQATLVQRECPPRSSRFSSSACEWTSHFAKVHLRCERTVLTDTPKLLRRLLDRVSLEEVSGDCGLGGGQTVEVAQQLVRDPSVRIDHDAIEVKRDHAAIEGVQDQLSEL